MRLMLWPRSDKSHVPVSYPTEILMYIVLCRFSLELFKTCKKFLYWINLTFKTKELVAAKRHNKAFSCILFPYKHIKCLWDLIVLCFLAAMIRFAVQTSIYSLGFNYFKSRLWTKTSGEKVQITINKEISEQNRTNVWVTLSK